MVTATPALPRRRPVPRTDDLDHLGVLLRIARDLRILDRRITALETEA